MHENILGGIDFKIIQTRDNNFFILEEISPDSLRPQYQFLFEEIIVAQFYSIRLMSYGDRVPKELAW